jgi:hydroxymethylbilane synthase
MTLRVGTRGSDLALAQTRWVIDRLRQIAPALKVETVTIETQGDRYTGPIGDEHWPIGGFVGAIESALLAGRIDAAVHSYKDLPTAETPGLVIAAVPHRELPDDVLVTAEPFVADGPSRRLRIGTSSARRAAQLRWFFPSVDVVPVRGNVPTRLAKVRALDLDGVVLAAAGLCRLGIVPEHAVALPIDRFVPAPAQGALAVQIRAGDDRSPLAQLDHPTTRLAITAERSFLAALGAGCQTPAGAIAMIQDDEIRLLGQLFSKDGTRIGQDVEVGPDPAALGEILAGRLARELQGVS